MSTRAVSTGNTKVGARDRVLRAALAAFQEKSPDRVRVQDIAVRAGMSSGHVLYYFRDRDRILISTLLLSEESLAERRDRAVRRARDAAAALDQLTRLYLPTGPRDVRWALWAQVIARPPEDLAMRDRLQELADAWTSCIAGLLQPSAPPDGLAAASLYCHLMDGLAIEVLLGASGHGRAWAVREAAAGLAALAGSESGAH